MKTHRLIFGPYYARITGLALLGTIAVGADAAAQVAVLGSTQEERITAPGQTYTGSITVLNGSDEEQNVRIYQTDYMFFADGRSPLDAPGTNPRSNAAWVKPSATTLRIAPRSQAMVLYEVSVPADSTLRGSYWSTIMIEPLRDVRAINRRGAVGVGSTVRYAVQIASHISNTGSRTVTFPRTQLVADSAGTPTLEVDVENGGGRAYRPLLWVEVYDAEGTLRAKMQQLRGLLYPGSSLRQRFALGALGPGAYKAILYADTGEESVFASELRLEL